MTVTATITFVLKEGKNVQNLTEELNKIKLKSASVMTVVASGTSQINEPFPPLDEGQTKKRS